jgi:hypothetical protein
MRRLYRGLLMVPFLGAPSVSNACDAVDFMAMEMPKHSPSIRIPTALTLAYQGLKINGKNVVFPDGSTIAIGDDNDRSPNDRMQQATIAEQFHDLYPLDFDLNARSKPWNDPGRSRNDAFFRALYGGREDIVRKSLRRVKGPIRSRFLMSHRQNVACQMQAALDVLSPLKSGETPAFTKIGGSFNWRQIAGTQRLSAHSFGIAFDLNSKLGGYWRWAGENEGHVGRYNNRIPKRVVETFERFGFVWGGKWHHYDGMHFEYRPELILFSRLKAH